MLHAVFVPMTGHSVVDVPRCDTSWYELYVWMLSRRRGSRRELVLSCWKRGRGEWWWRWAGRGDWWRGSLVRKRLTTLLTVNEDLGVTTHSERPSSSRDRRYEYTSIVASETLRVSCQENFKAWVLRENVGKITIIHLKDPRKKFSPSPSLLIAFSHGRWACKNFDERDVGAGTRAVHVTAPGAFAFKPHENRNFGAIICVDNVTFWSRGIALWVVWQWKTHPSFRIWSNIIIPIPLPHCQKCRPPVWLSLKIPRGSERVKAPNRFEETQAQRTKANSQASFLIF